MSNFHMPSVTLVNNRPSTASLAIAEHFEKQHKNVLRDIETLVAECSENFNGLNFELVDYTDAKGEKRPMYHVFFDGFMLPVMGYTGKKALQMKLAYIEAFNAMQAKLDDMNRFNPDAALTTNQQTILRAILKNRLDDPAIPNHGKRMALYQFAWKNFCNEFGLAKFSQLPQSAWRKRSIF